ncbi:MAG: hypothetical protein ACE5GN_00500 [Waddliaceae bacterium]
MADDSVSNINLTPGKGSDFRAKGVPSGKTKKDFKKILGKEKREGREHPGEKEQVKEDKSVKGKESYEDVARQMEDIETGPEKTKVSLFELAAAQEEAVETAPVEEKIPIAEIPEDLQEESLSALFKGYGSKEKLKSPEASTPSPKTTLQAEKGKPASQFAQEQPDLSSVNPMAAQQATAPTPSTGIKGPQQSRTIAPQIQEIIDQIIDKLYMVKIDGRMDTLITLKHPPLFAGTNVVITSFDTAKGEFNIAFENLTQAAKQVLDLQDNQNALRFGLEQKGYAVHILTTTTISETLAFVEGEAPAREGREEQDSSGQGQKEENQEENEN